MSYEKYILLSILLLGQQILVLCVPNFNSLKIEEENSINSKDKKYWKFSYNYKDIETNNILYISCNTSDYINPGYLYASFSDTISEDERLFSSQENYINELYINLNKYKEGTLYLLVKPYKEDSPFELTLIAKLINRINITDDKPEVRFKLNHISDVYYTIKETIEYDKLLIYGLGEDWNFFDMTIQYNNLVGAIQNIKVKQIFENGFGAIIDLNQLSKNINPNKEIRINVQNTSSVKMYNAKVKIGIERVDQGRNYKRQFKILEHIYGATNSFETCYNISEALNMTKQPILLINAVSQAIIFTMKNESDNSKQTINLFHNSYIRLNNQLNATNYFCIKRYQSEDIDYEEYGESSYDFQLYYEDDLENIQPFLMPLVNGKFYNHTLTKEKMRVYRHLSFAKYGSTAEYNDTHIYTANLVKISGNPKLYGYSCISYPDCVLNKVLNISKYNLEEIENINNYYVNKIIDAPGNMELNENGESHCEGREQYLSVVICEEDEYGQNNGECKYTIEINNENEDMRLVAENIYATTLFPGDNYFSIQVANYKDVKNMNISLTMLTGQATMKVYSDVDGEYEIVNYNRHKIFRKEVLEFKKTDIQEVYWAIISCQETAFVEIKYVTEFHSKGYIQTNPNEVNIEFINQESSQYPYNIVNPYYYSTNNNNNKDFYFKIRTQECTMNYTYNNEITIDVNAIDKELKETDSSYKDSYSFTSSVISYNYNTNKNSDCTMFIYNGLINSEERPLLLAADIDVPFNFLKNSFIYPFIKDESSKTFKVDIKFTDNNRNNPSYKIILKVKNTILEEKSISNDETFTIMSNNESINCGNNIQCILKIQVNKNDINDNNAITSNNLTIKVYSIESQVFEIIEQKVTSTKIYIQKDTNKIIKVSIGQSEEVQYNFRTNSGKTKISAVLVNKNSDYDESTIFEDTAQSNLITSTNGILQIRKEDTKICNEGCNLLMKIEIENANNDLVEVTLEKSGLKSETKKEKNKKEMKVWLAVVLIIVCVVVVSGILVAIYFFILRKKNTNYYQPNYYRPNNKNFPTNCSIPQRSVQVNNSIRPNNNNVRPISQNTSNIQRRGQINNNSKSNNFNNDINSQTRFQNNGINKNSGNNINQ